MKQKQKKNKEEIQNETQVNQTFLFIILWDLQSYQPTFTPPRAPKSSQNMTTKWSNTHLSIKINQNQNLNECFSRFLNSIITVGKTFFLFHAFCNIWLRLKLLLNRPVFFSFGKFDLIHDLSQKSTLQFIIKTNPNPQTLPVHGTQDIPNPRSFKHSKVILNIVTNCNLWACTKCAKPFNSP